MAAPTSEELPLIAKFRQNVKDLDLNEFMRSDMGLVQWLRARELNLAKAEEMLRKSMKYRAENEIDTILSWQAPQEFRSICPLEYTGYDKENCPVCYMPFGRWNLRKVFNAGQRAIYVKYLSQLFEQLLVQMKGRVTPSGVPVTQGVVIFDAQGLSLRTLASIGAVSMHLEACQNMEANNPETMKHCIVINASRIFTAFYNLVKPMLSQRTVDKIPVHGTDVEAWMKYLLEKIDQDQLPKELIDMWNVVRSGKNKNNKMDEEEDDARFANYVTTTLAAGTKRPIEFEVTKAKSVLSWCYMTTNYDVGFSVTFGTDTIVPYKKANSHSEEQKGSINCEKAGTYVFTFDNSYSLLREKILTYRIWTDETA